MALNQIFDIAGSGMAAQSIRLNTTASNLANADTASATEEGAYRARKPVFSAIQQQLLENSGRGKVMDANQERGVGVEVRGIVQSDEAVERRYQPNHPLANEDGYVFYSNVNTVEEMADMMSASRSFQNNVEVMNAAKSMMQRILTLGQ
ncbi:flagellar basal body rod protein FlgC [Marinobacteraceae bacterium S3BR75-40.1]